MTTTTGQSLENALTALKANYIDANPKSAERDRLARKSLPGGNTRTTLFYDPFPLVFARAEGSRLESIDGDAYVDFLGEYTAGLYGHSNPVIMRRLHEVLDEGIVLGGYNRYEAEFAAELSSRFPSMQLLRFTNSGTEANLMALSAATAHTGRQGIVVFDGAYHGGVLSFSIGVEAPNVPHDFRRLRYNDEPALRQFMQTAGNEIAAVIVEPMLGSGGNIPAAPSFLRALREETERAGALLIFDEVMTSRLGPSGMQGRLAITPDLTTLGKYLGGGMSFGAFGGRADIMERFDPSKPGSLPHAGTFNNNVLTMAAGLEGLRRILTPEVIDELNQRGDSLRTELNRAFDVGGVSLQATGVGSLLSIHAVRGRISSAEDLMAADQRIKELLFFHLLEDGFWMARRGMIALSLAVRDEEIAGLVESVRSFVERYGELIR